MKQAVLAGAALLCASPFPSQAAPEAFLPTAPTVVSVAGDNGDQNPYGVAFIHSNFNAGTGPLQPGDILVSNFNNSNNLQGTGTTIMAVTPRTGTAAQFFVVPSATLGGAGTGLTTALGVLRKGFILVGSLPSADGMTAASAGSLLVINNQGQQVGSISDPLIDGPWDMALIDHNNTAIAFVSNVLSGTVVRLDLEVSASGVALKKKTVIASGYQHRFDSMAFVVGPTGLLLDDGVLYVASTEDNAVYAVENPLERKTSAGTGKIIYSDLAHLHGPLGLAEAPNGHLLVTNGDVINGDPNQPSEIVEFTKSGHFVTQLSVDPGQGGSFGLAVAVEANLHNAFLAAVDDVATTLIIYTIPLE